MRWIFVLAIAAVMSIIGAFAVPFVSHIRDFGLFELIIPSCITWLLLSRILSDAPFGLTVAVGFLSPFVGAIFWSMLAGLRSGHFAEGLFIWIFVVPYVKETWPVTVPIGVSTAFLIRFTMNFRNGQHATEQLDAPHRGTRGR